MDAADTGSRVGCGELANRTSPLAPKSVLIDRVAAMVRFAALTSTLRSPKFAVQP